MPQWKRVKNIKSELKDFVTFVKQERNGNSDDKDVKSDDKNKPERYSKKPGEYFAYNNWDFNFFLRGTFGHNLINSYRAFYEPVVPGQISSYNRVNTKYFNHNLTSTQWSSLYV